MSDTKRYRFSTAAQWHAGQLARAQLGADGSITTLAPWGAALKLAGAGSAAGVTPDGIAYWNDGATRLWQADPDAIVAQSQTAPAALARAARFAAGRVQLWAADARPMVMAYLLDAPVLRLKLDLAEHGITRIIDIAADGADGIWVLGLQAAHAVALHVDCSGQPGDGVALPEPCGAPRGITWIAGRLVVLDATGTLLTWVDPQHPEATLQVSLRSARPGGAATCITSDAKTRIVVVVVDAAAFGAGAWLVDATPDGDLLGTIDLADAPMALACHASSLIVTSAGAVWRYKADASGTARRSETSASFITPLLESPPAESRAPWLRAELSAVLPEGCSVELAYATSDDKDQLAAVRALLAQTGLAPAARRQRLADLLPWSAPLRFEAIAGGDAAMPTNCVLPLHDLRTRSLLVSVELIAAPGAAAPRIESLDVLYPDESLMQYLPAIYRRQAEQQPGDFVRILVAALETSVASLDARIAGLGQLVDPHDAPEPWLDAIARWLGLPWDDALPIEVKRRLLEAAPALLEQRGTRGGLQALFAALLPTGRARIVDTAIEHGFVSLAGRGCRGARLPALLAGWRCDSIVLNQKACIGIGRLGPATNPVDSVSWLMGLIEVEVTATPAERRAWSAWLPTLIAAMMPLTAQLQLRWNTSALPAVPRLGNSLLLDHSLSLAAEPPLRLGSGAALGNARLSGLAGVTLSGAGNSPGFELH